MANLGAFQQQDDGSYTGSIRTLALDLKTVTFRPVEKSKPKSPAFRVFAGKTEIGAAWNETSKQDREYVSVKLDDPSFPAPILATLIEVDGVMSLIWSRRDPPKKAKAAQAEPAAD